MEYSQIPLALSLVFIVAGLAALAWSSDLFVDGSASLARVLGVSPFVVGMVVIGFGTSAPELCVSVMSGLYGHSNLSLGNAYGSCSFNIAVILGVAALIRPLAVRPSVALVAGPGLAAVALFSAWLLRDGSCTRYEASVLLAAFLVVMPLYCWFDRRTKSSSSSSGDADARPDATSPSVAVAAFQVLLGLVVLIGSSHFLVWGSVSFARFIGVSDLVIGLTVVAVGTSLPELASAIAAARRGENEFVLGNIIGSNLFNTLAVVGLATVIGPLAPGADGKPPFSPYVLSRDLPVMAVLSMSILLFGLNWRRPSVGGTIGRWKGVVWLAAAAAYTALMLFQELGCSR